jgi:glycosyltransferase involved in cell wall biosynthesis
MPHDAVGNDVLGMYESFRKAGYDTSIYAQHIDPAHQSYAKRADRAARSVWRNPEDVLIYHHAIDWELGEEILAGAKCKVVIKHHNVTPARFFAGYASRYYESCRRGVEASRRLAKHPTAWIWADSTFNENEFIEFGAQRDRCRVLAPLHRIEELARAPLDNLVVGTYRGAVPNILFVGGLRPNKGHAKAIEVFAAYRRQSGLARLIFAGHLDPALGSYLEDLKRYAEAFRVERDVRFALSVSPSQLRAYYYVSSAFLCVSEHEGFCVPIVESMFFRIPIVAWANAAVAETCGEAGFSFPEFDVRQLADALAQYLENPAARRDAAAQGRRRYERAFAPPVIQRRLTELLREVERA